MYRRWALFLILSAICLPLGGCVSTLASAYLWGIRAASPVNWNGHDRIELPLMPESGNRPAVTVQVMGKPVLALLDTGSPVPTMRPATATATGAQVKSPGEGHREARDVLVQLGAASIKLSTVFVGEASTNAGISFGQELFSQAVVEVDFDTGYVTLIRPDAFIPPDVAPMSVRLSRSRPAVQLEVNGNGRRFCAIVDTGFDGGVAVTPDMAAELSLPTVPGTSIGRGFGGKRAEGPALAPLDEVRMGDLLYGNVPVMGQVPNTDKKEACRNLLGMAVLARHHLIFDMANHRIWLLPRSGVQQSSSAVPEYPRRRNFLGSTCVPGAAFRRIGIPWTHSTPGRERRINPRRQSR